MQICVGSFFAKGLRKVARCKFVCFFFLRIIRFLVTSSSHFGSKRSLRRLFREYNILSDTSSGRIASSAMDRDPLIVVVLEDFDGAGPGTSLNMDDGKNYVCAQCSTPYWFFGCLAAMKKPDFAEFYRHTPAAVTRTIDGITGQTFQSIGSDGKKVQELGLVCYKCAGTTTKGNELYFVHPETNKLTSEWMHKMKASKFVPSSKKEERIAERAMTAWIRRAERKRRLAQDDDDLDDAPCAEEVVAMMRTHLGFKKGIDWVNQMGPNVFLLYGHSQCDREVLNQSVRGAHSQHIIASMDRPGLYPLKSSKWLRLAGPNVEMQYGQSQRGTSFATWHCAGCVGKWLMAEQGEFRLLVAADMFNLHDEDRVFCAYIGPTLGNKDALGVQQEKEIQILKGATMLEMLGDQEITKELILHAISQLNAECEEKLGTLANVVSVESINHQNSVFNTRQLYCEDTRLSIGFAGTPYLALAVDKGSVPTLTPELLQIWIDFCASFLNLSAYKPNGPAERKTLQILIERVTKLNLRSRI